MTPTLYQRLGGAQGLARIVDDVIAAHLANPIVKTRFENAKDLGRLREKALEFFSAGSGGPPHYSGKDMRQAHQGMNISEQEYLAVMDDITGVLRKHAIDEEACGQVVAILYSLKGEIIRV